MPKVSVIVPAYNAMQFLPKTVDSVLKQTYQDFEIFIINDGSTDNIEEWVRTVEDKRVRLISQHNQGQSAARNEGIKNSSGQYIAFLDADDLWAPSKLEKQVQVLDSNPDTGLVYSWVSLIDENDHPLDKTWTISEEGDVWLKLIEGNIIACGSVPMIRRSCVEVVGLFEKFPFACEDWDYWLRIASHYSFEVLKEVLVYYRDSPGSLSRYKGDALEKRLKAMEESYGAIIERAFKDVPESSQYLKHRSHALANLRIAWQALKMPDRRYKYADFYSKKAISYAPDFSDSSEFSRFRRASYIIRFLGVQNYERIKRLITAIFEE